MNHDKVLWYDDWKIEELVGNSSKERWHKTPESLALCHPSIAPVVLDGDESSFVQDGSDQRVHLGHVRKDPEEPHAHASQKQRHLHNPSVGIFGHKYGQ